MTLPLDPIIFNICLFEPGTISCFGHLPLGKDDQMQNMPSERAFEMVDRDMPVTVDGKPDKSKTNTRLGYSLQRLFEPITAEQLDQLDHLLMLLDQSPSQDRK